LVAHTKDKTEYTLHKTIGFIEEQAPKECFFKINKGIIANMSGVAYIRGSDLIFEDGTVLLIAQRRRSRCMEFLKKYIKEHM
jgi:DNA-binding LytR/AlgR family response regulator